MPSGSHAIISVDAQGGLGSSGGDSARPSLVSEQTRRGEMLRDLMVEFDLIAAITFSREKWGQCACFFDDRKGPRRIDFLLVQRDWLRK
eukprot:4117724-Pyramimonas_sp.AAC.1